MANNSKVTVEEERMLDSPQPVEKLTEVMVNSQPSQESAGTSLQEAGDLGKRFLRSQNLFKRQVRRQVGRQKSVPFSIFIR
jgi:hypothetical protein